MRPNLLMTIILPQLISCQSVKHENETSPSSRKSPVASASQRAIPQTIGNIVTPYGFTRTPATDGSFAAWLRSVQLKSDATVFLYNGDLKANQLAQFAVLNIPVGTKDLQQCADAVMRMRAQFLYDNNRFGEICFADNNGKKYQYANSSDGSFERYLEKVFTYCGSLSLARQLKTTSIDAMKIGDVLIRGGSPGHAVIVVDMAVDR